MSDYLLNVPAFTPPTIPIDHAEVQANGGFATNTVTDSTVISEVRIFASIGGFSGGTSGGGGGWPQADHPTLGEGDGETIPVDWSTLTDAAKHALCSLSHSVAGLDGKLLYGGDGDGVDEFLNIVTAASVVIGGAGGLATMLGKVAAGTLSSAAVLDGIATVFGETVALEVSYSLAPALSAIGSAVGITGTSGAAFATLFQALTDGNPPPDCGTSQA